VRSPLRILIGGVLILEGLSAALGVASRLTMLPAYPIPVLLMIAARALVGALEAMSGWLLLDQRPAAVPLARLAILLSAVHVTLGVGFGFAPTNLDPAFRTPFVIGYWIFAALVWAALASQRQT
jgi:hypothetical protein